MYANIEKLALVIAKEKSERRFMGNEKADDWCRNECRGTGKSG